MTHLPKPPHHGHPIAQPEVGERGYPDRTEWARLLVWTLAMAGFLVWLSFGVNV